MDHFSLLPVELLQSLPNYLSGPNIARLSFSSPCLYNALNLDMFWRRCMKKERLYTAPQITKYVETLLESLSEPLSATHRLEKTCKEKIMYLVLRKIRKNWARSNYKEGMIHHFTDEVRIGFDSEHLVALETGRIRTWDLTGKWISLLSSTSIPVNLANPDQNIYQILVHQGVAILCFSFGDSTDNLDWFRDASNFQLLRAYDLDDECKFLWEKSGLLGMSNNVVRLLGPHLYILDLVQDLVTVYPITKTDPHPLIVLTLPQATVRLPHGMMSADGVYFTAPGKSVPEQSPVLVAWCLETGERKVLRPNTPVCPFRWFQNTAIKDGVILGLLNRFRLLGWTGSTGEVKFSVDLTNSSPGSSDESYSWLETAPGLILTVHRETLYVTVVSMQGHVVGDIRPILPDWCYGEDIITMVEEVSVCGHMAVLRVICYSQGDQITCLLLPVDLTQFHQVLEEREAGRLEHLAQLANVAATHCEEAGSSHCVAMLTSTKLMDVQPLGIKFYDYLTTEERFPGPRPPCHHHFETID